MTKKKPRILIIRCGLLGDTIDSTAVVKPLVDYYGDDLEIEWVTKPNLVDLFKYDKRITPIKLRFTKLPLLINIAKLRIIFNSYLNPYDSVINLELGVKFKSLARFIRSTVKVGMPYKYIAENIKGEHRVHHQLRIVNSYYKNIQYGKSYPYLIGSNINVKNKYNLKRQYVVLCPTNSKFKKNNYRGYRAWPIENWNKLIDIILKKTELDIAVTGGENEKKFIDQINFSTNRIHNLCGQTNLPDLIEVMKNSDCVVANDSGSVHVAGVSCKKVISLHGPTPFSETGPYGNSKNEIIEANIRLKCSPCYNTDVIKKCGQNRCMIDLSPEKIFEYM